MNYSNGNVGTRIASLALVLVVASSAFAKPIAPQAVGLSASPTSTSATASKSSRSTKSSAKTTPVTVAKAASGASTASVQSRASVAAASAGAARSRAAASVAAVAAAQSRAAAAAAAAQARAVAASNALAAEKAAAAARSAAAQAAAVRAQAAAAAAKAVADAQAAAAAAAAKALADAQAAAAAQALADAQAAAAAAALAAAPRVTPPITSAVSVPPFPIIYDSAPAAGFVSPVASASRYLIVYQSDFGAYDPSAQTDVDVNPAAVIAAIRQKLSQPLSSAGYSEWGVLDIENPFDEILKNGPSDARFDRAVASLVNVIRAVRSAYPQMKWTYYAFPRVPYWMGINDWGQLTKDEREAKYAEFARNYEPIMAEMDWFMPSLYDVYEGALQMPRCASPREVAEAEYRKACVCAVSRWFTRAGVDARPIIPVVSPWFQPGGVATAYKPIPMEEFCAEQVRPAIESGASGMAIWGEMGFFLKMATASNLPSDQYVQDWQAQTRSAFASIFPAGNTALAPSAPAANIDWFAPSTAQAIGATLNESMSSAMRAIEARGITSAMVTN